MKKKFAKSFILLAAMSVILLLNSCGILATKPLAAENETHEELLEGVWKSLPINDGSSIYTVKKQGKYYIAKLNNGKTQHKLTLTKLNNRYFISDIGETFSTIWMIHVDERNLILYTLSGEVLDKYKNAFDKNGVIQFSTSELKKLCASHINDFSVVVQKFTRISQLPKPNAKTTVSSTQKLYTDFTNELFSCLSEIPSAGNSQAELIETGNKFQSIAEQMYSVISRYNLPQVMQNAAIDFTQSISNAGKTFRAAPYMPVNELDAFMTGVFNGLLYGDITGGAAEMSQWQNAIKVKIEAIKIKEENLKIILIKHGVKF